MRGAEQPFLFFPEDLDVRWRSFAAVAEQVEEGRRRLAELGLAPGAVVAYRWRCGPDAVAADLAIRSGGWTAAPVAGGSPVPPGWAARLLLPSERSAEGGMNAGSPTVALPEATREVGRRAGGAFPPRRGADGDELPGGALARRPEDSAEGWRAEDTDALAWRAAALGRALDRALGRTWGEAGVGPRPVVAAWLDPAVPEGRAVLDWAVAARAALYLEPDPRILGGASEWVRPTVVAGDLDALSSVMVTIRREAERGARRARRLRWAHRLVGRRRRAPRPPFGRLRAVVVADPQDLEPEDRELLAAQGVAILRPEI